jgi:hypothetical protein
VHVPPGCGADGTGDVMRLAGHPEMHVYREFLELDAASVAAEEAVERKAAE